jgi:hypothetical protein
MISSRRATHVADGWCALAPDPRNGSGDPGTGLKAAPARHPALQQCRAAKLFYTTQATFDVAFVFGRVLAYTGWLCKTKS